MRDIPRLPRDSRCSDIARRLFAFSYGAEASLVSSYAPTGRRESCLQRHPSEVKMMHQNTGLRAAMDGVRDLVVICDPHGTITFINRAMEIFAGIEFGEILPEPWSAYGEMLHPDGELFLPGTDPMHRSLRGESVGDEEIVFTGASGQPRNMTVDSHPLLDQAGVLAGAIV